MLADQASALGLLVKGAEESQSACGLRKLVIRFLARLDGLVSISAPWESMLECTVREKRPGSAHGLVIRPSSSSPALLLHLIPRTLRLLGSPYRKMSSPVHNVLQARQWKPCAACTPKLTFPSSQTSPLLKLPAELLDLIFEDVYRHKRLSAPPCRALFAVHDKLLAPRYKQIKIRYASALTAYCAALRMGRGLGPLCTSFVMVTGTWQFPAADADLLFHSLPNLRRLQLVDKSLIEPFFVCLDKSTTPLMPELVTLTLEGTRDEGVDPYCATQLALLARLGKLKTLAVRYHDRLSDVSRGIGGAPSTLPSITRLILRTSKPASSARLVQACTALEQLEMINLATTNDGWSALLAAAPEPGTLLAGEPKSTWKIPKEIKRFTPLKSLTLNSGCTAVTSLRSSTSGASSSRNSSSVAVPSSRLRTSAPSSPAPTSSSRSRSCQSAA